MAEFVPKNRLQQSGIEISRGLEIQPKLMIKYPSFTTSSDLRDALTPKMFEEYRSVLTTLKNSLRPILKAGLENENKRQNLYASDGDCYHTYSKLYQKYFESFGAQQALLEALDGA